MTLAVISTVLALLAFMNAMVSCQPCRKAFTACGRFAITSSRTKNTWVMKWSTNGVAAGDDAPFLGFLERVADFERADVAVDLAGLDRGARRRHAADRHRGDAGRAPALERADALADPVGQRADGGDAELLALEVVDRLDRRVVADHHRHVARHAGHGADRLGRHALDHERHAGPAADADVDAVGGQSLLHPGVAAEGRRFDLEAVLGEDAGLHADVERREGPGERHRLADAQLLAPRRPAARPAATASSIRTARNNRGMASSLAAVRSSALAKSLQKSRIVAMRQACRRSR